VAPDHDQFAPVIDSLPLQSGLIDLENDRAGRIDKDEVRLQRLGFFIVIKQLGYMVIEVQVHGLHWLPAVHALGWTRWPKYRSPFRRQNPLARGSRYPRRKKSSTRRMGWRRSARRAG